MNKTQVCRGPEGVVVIEVLELQPNHYTFFINVNGDCKLSLTMNGDFQTCLKAVKLRLISENYIY